MRYLRITRRTVPLDRLEEYAAGWADLCTAAEALGCRAWVFRRAGHEDRFIEFIEWAGAERPLEADPLSNALLELDGFGVPQDADVWEEASLP